MQIERNETEVVSAYHSKRMNNKIVIAEIVLFLRCLIITGNKSGQYCGRGGLYESRALRPMPFVLTSSAYS